MAAWQKLTGLRIAHQLALLLTACVLLAALVVGGVLAFNLRAGFDDYLRSKDLAQAQRFAAFLAEYAGTDPDFAKLRDGPQGIRNLLADFSQREGLAVRGPKSYEPGPPRGDEPGPRPPGLNNSPGPGPAVDERHPPPRQGPGAAYVQGRAALPSGPLGGAIGPRLQIFDAQGRWIAGRQQPMGSTFFSTPVLKDGRLIANVRVTEEHSKEVVDAHFLRRQYWGLLLAVAGVSFFAAGVALWVASRWSKPLREVQRATGRIAGGAFDVRLNASGAQELAELAQDVNRMGQALSQMEASRKRWIAQTAHELRTPLAVLQGELESAEDGAREPNSEWLKRLLGEVKQLTRLVRDLHTLSVNDMGRPVLDLMDVDAGQLVRNARERHAERLDARGLILELGLVESASVRWDVGRIAQVLDNLVENSRRYTDAPGTVRITGEALAAMYRIRVDDSPPGVASDELELLFEPLYRGDAARTRGGEPGRSAASTGLGLAIVKAMVEAHGGQISARNSDLGGLRMEVLLPWQAPNATDALPTFSPTRIAPPSGLKESQDEYLAKQAF